MNEMWWFESYQAQCNVLHNMTFKFNNIILCVILCFFFNVYFIVFITCFIWLTTEFLISHIYEILWLKKEEVCYATRPHAEPSRHFSIISKQANFSYCNHCISATVTGVLFAASFFSRWLGGWFQSVSQREIVFRPCLLFPITGQYASSRCLPSCWAAVPTPPSCTVAAAAAVAAAFNAHSCHWRCSVTVSTERVH